MPKKSKSPMAKSKAKLTDAERHARFVETARKVGASEDPADFEKAFKKATTRKSSSPDAT
jgi:hypothetical protein